MATRAKDIETLKALTGNSLVEIYGPTRSGKGCQEGGDRYAD